MFDVVIPEKNSHDRRLQFCLRATEMCVCFQSESAVANTETNVKHFQYLSDLLTSTFFGHQGQKTPLCEQDC